MPGVLPSRTQTRRRFLLAIEDITASKEAEAALQAQRDWFDGTLSSIGDGVIATDVHGLVSSWVPVAEVSRAGRSWRRRGGLSGGLPHCQ